MLIAVEPYALFAIQKPARGVPPLFSSPYMHVVDDMSPFFLRKVRILNGAHTAMVPFSIMYGSKTVKEAIDNSFIGEMVNQIMFNEINETIAMEKAELNSYAEEVLDRFRNPFIKHNLSSIALNSISKFKVRVLPSLTGFIEKYNQLPVYLTFSFAALIRFYQGEWKNEKLPVDDNTEIVDFFNQLWKSNNLNEIVDKTLSNLDFWETDLREINGLSEALVIALQEIEENGIEKGFLNFKSKIS
jgi:tagaturonate reductase